MFFKHFLTTTDQHLKQDLCNIPIVWLLLLCGMCLNVQQLSLSQFIPAAHEDATFLCNQTKLTTPNVSYCDLPILSLFVTEVVEVYISSDFHFIIDIDCHQDNFF
jgi:hypothetical protein